MIRPLLGSLTSLVATGLLPHIAFAQQVSIPSTSFDWVRRVNYGSSTVFEANAEAFSVYAVGDSNSAQQTWFRVRDAVAQAGRGRTVREAKLIFQAGTEDDAKRTVYLCRTSLGVSAAVNRSTYDGSHSYPSVPGSAASFQASGWLSKPMVVSVDARGGASVDVTDWLKQHPDDSWLLTASPAAAGQSVDQVAGANWGVRWHWQNRLASRPENAAVRLVVDFATPDDSPPIVTQDLPARLAQYAGEGLKLSVRAATGVAALSYQWQKDGKPVAGAQSSEFLIPRLAKSDAGRYQLEIRNRHGRVTSSSCDVYVAAIPDLANFTPPVGQNTRYHAAGNAVIGVQQQRFFNRPHYSNHTDCFILTGDKPMVKFASGETVHGHFMVGVKRGGTTKWLHDFARTTTAFQPAHTTWLAQDPAFPGLKVRLQSLTLEGVSGFASRVSAVGVREGDQLVWAYGGTHRPGGKLNWSIDPYPVGEDALLKARFEPDSAKGNRVNLNEANGRGIFSLSLANGSEPTTGRVSAGQVSIADASAWATPASLLASQAVERPMVVGTLPLNQATPHHWAFFRTDAALAATSDEADPKRLFLDGLARSADFASRLAVETPDARVNAAAAMAVAGIDGMWYGNKFVHGSMSWNSPYLGWRTTIGGTMLGWHDRVQRSAENYLGHQVTNDSHHSGELMGVVGGKDYLLTKPATNSRFYGKGYIGSDQTFYEMQTQYFDQILQDWRWRLQDDPAYEAKLLRATELHLERMQACYDPDNDGTYESVINTWPTDCIWFNGGGCADATAYAYRAHAFARDLARRAGDAAAADRHQRRMEVIQSGFFRDLWVAEAGHPGLFREQGGHRRLVNNPWLYSHCIPIEADMLTREQAATTLFNTEYNLENLYPASGGRRVVTSNFTPAIWSVRVLWPGDNYMLALAYFRAGLARQGWEVLRGNILHTGFNDLVPGDSVDLVGGTDFGDTVHTFARAMVEGLFGYQPNYPFGSVLVAPQFPADWDRAAISTPAVAMSYRRSGGKTTLTVRLQRDCTLNVELPVQTSVIHAVRVGGTSVPYEVLPGFGGSLVKLSTQAKAHQEIEVVIDAADRLPEVAPIKVAGVVGSDIQVDFADGAVPVQLISVSDPRAALQGVRMEGSRLLAKLPPAPGHRRVIAVLKVGQLEQQRLVDLHIQPDPASPATALAEVPAGARWQPIDMTAQLSADITQIYEQKYLSPRPKTVSSRIGTDGYSPWCFPHWGVGRPTIRTEWVAKLADPAKPGHILTPQGVPFRWGGEARNVAFVSLWDNWPDQVEVPVQHSGRAAWFLVCGSTTVMQGRIANAVLRLRYADGVEDRLELVPPFNYWNLCPIKGIQARAQFGASDYTEPSESFTVPKPWPSTVQLGSNCRAIVLNRILRPGVELRSVTLEALSQESVIGLMGISIMDP